MIDNGLVINGKVYQFVEARGLIAPKPWDVCVVCDLKSQCTEFGNKKNYDSLCAIFDVEGNSTKCFEEVKMPKVYKTNKAPWG